MSDIYGGIHVSTPMDLLHGFCAGLFKTVLAASLSVLLKIGGGDYYSLFTGLEVKMRRMKRFPTISGFAGIFFDKGKILSFFNIK